MDRKIMGALVGLSALAVGCAADAPDVEALGAESEVSETAQVTESEDPTIGVTFVALTVIDCQTEATKCLSANASGRSSQAADCSAQLNECLADVKLQAPRASSQGAKDTLACGNGGVTCISDASGAVDCQRKVEKCVVDSVGRATGLGVGAIAKLLGVALDTIGTVVGATVPVVGAVVETATGVVKPLAGVVGNVVDAAGTVIKPVVNAAGQILDQTGKVIGTTVSAAGEVVGATVNAAGQVIDAGGKVIGQSVGIVGDVFGAGGQVIGGTIGAAGGLLGGLGDGIAKASACSTESQKCWRDTRDYASCQKVYNACARR